jgi:hypothetical protein
VNDKTDQMAAAGEQMAIDKQDIIDTQNSLSAP